MISWIRTQTTRTTEDLLSWDASTQTIDYVMAVRGYLDLLDIYPERKQYLHKLSSCLLHLAKIAETSGAADLAQRFHSITLHIQWHARDARTFRPLEPQTLRT
jgi:hypothetical protein